MFSVCSSLRCSFPQWRWRSGTLGILFQSIRRVRVVCASSSSAPSSSSMNEDSGSIPKQRQVDFDPAVDLFGLDVNLQSRNVVSGEFKPRSWFGPNGQYIRELPCPSCRGRGYTPCTECGIERSRLDCSQCHGKGLRTCKKCFGDCVIWEESIDEQPWEKARTSSPLKVKDDDEVDKLDIELDVTRKSKRVYQSLSPEVSLKISRSLRSLNAKTGLFSKRMKILHRDPELFAHRVAAIKKAKGTPAARKRASEAMKAFFSDPDNRRKRSLSMKGVKFYCSNCGEEGHRRHYCPELDVSRRRYKCKCHLCGERGHNRRTCPKAPSDQRRNNHCSLCTQSGHNRSKCPNRTDVNGDNAILIKAVPTSKGMPFYCSNCGEQGHSSSNCPAWGDTPRGSRRCQLCGEKGQNRRMCPNTVSGEQQRDPLYFCKACGESGRNWRTCPQVSSSPNKTITVNHVTCSFCLMKGHNIRTCPSRNHSLKV